MLYKERPEQKRIWKTKLETWREIGVFTVTEQRLADQARAIKTNEWLVEIEELKRKIKNESRDSDNTESYARSGQHYTGEKESILPQEQPDGGRHEELPQQSGESILEHFNQIREKMVNEGSNAEKIVILEMIFEEMKIQ